MPPLDNPSRRVSDVGDWGVELFSKRFSYISVMGGGLGGTGDGLIRKYKIWRRNLEENMMGCLGGVSASSPSRDLIMLHRREGLDLCEHDYAP